MSAIRQPKHERILSADVPADIAQAIRELAKRDDRTTSAYVRRVLAAHVRKATGGEVDQ